jgi:putative acetyltransferase
MMSGIYVTQEEPHHPAAAALIAALSAELAAAYPGFGSGDGSGAFKPADILVPRAAFVVAWRGEEALGCGALRPMPDPQVGEVKRMFVLPAARGMGISRLILTKLEELAREFGYRSLVLETGMHQTAAIGLYESAGYQCINCYGIYAQEPTSRCYQKTLLIGVGDEGGGDCVGE